MTARMPTARPSPVRSPTPALRSPRSRPGAHAPALLVALTAAALIAGACVDRALSLDDVGVDTEPVDPGMRPPEPDVMWGPCDTPGECPFLPACVFPQGESGYCTDFCAAVTSPSRPDPVATGECEPSPGGSALVQCVNVGSSDNAQIVCALDCDDRRTCPGGMRCEAVQTADGARRLCF
jgi:hypothetical protein